MINPVWNPFSRYADKLEKKLDKILRKVAFLGVFESQRLILQLMQDNLVIVSLWLEARFKGYKYLKKGKRKKLYLNAEMIALEFAHFRSANPISMERVAARIRDLGLAIPGMPGDEEKIIYLTQIMEFLRPHAGRFVYLEGASFGKLLTNPEKKEPMVGDCNQIVTFYTFLYAHKFPVKELQIKMLPGHVCLHFKGIDIEATSGSFANYNKDCQILPIAELISTNLLDVSDFRDTQIQVEPRDFLQAAHLAYDLSSDRELVGKNLKIAYQNVAIQSLKAQKFDTAIFFLEKAGLSTPDEVKILQTVYHNAVIYHIKHKSFRKARSYASKSSETDLRRYIDEQEASYNYNNNKLEKARELFGKIGNQQMVKACYAKEYNNLQARVAGLKDLAVMKSHKSDYRKMLDLAYKMEDQGLIQNLQKLLSQL